MALLLSFLPCRTLPFPVLPHGRLNYNAPAPNFANPFFSARAFACFGFVIGAWLFSFSAISSSLCLNLLPNLPTPARKIVAFYKDVDNGWRNIPPNRKTDQYSVVVLHIRKLFCNFGAGTGIVHLNRTAAFLFVQSSSARV